MDSGAVTLQPMALTAREPPNLSQAPPEQAAPPLLERRAVQPTSGKGRSEGSLEAQLRGPFPGGGPSSPDFLQDPHSTPGLRAALQLLLSERMVGNQTLTRMGS